MSAIKTQPAFKRRIYIKGNEGGLLSDAFGLVCGEGSHFLELMYWTTDGNGFHFLRAPGDINVEGWETIKVLDFPLDVMGKARRWVNAVPDADVVNYMQTVEDDPSLASRQRGWCFLVDDKCLGACRVIPTFG
ncbi:hypothetical protein HYS42_00690 [Candidatus Saccharibacteria bacterium]|nr:hypothetical protein [Candidatus Saccharibacteria bacterium]